LASFQAKKTIAGTHKSQNPTNKKQNNFFIRHQQNKNVNIRPVLFQRFLFMQKQRLGFFTIASRLFFNALQKIKTGNIRIGSYNKLLHAACESADN
jgi:hypothetical protein